MTQMQGGERRRHAAPLQPFQRRHQRDRDDQGGGDRQEEFGAGAQRERQGDSKPAPNISTNAASSRSRR